MNEVIPETVGQFTNICDKNGKNILGEDVVKLCDTNPVIFKMKIKTLQRMDIKLCLSAVNNRKVAENYFQRQIEVVGNIFQPRTLEVEK